MSFRLTYAEIRQMIRRKALHTRWARAIMRKSGFRQMTPEASAAGARGTPILSLSPCVAAAGCPRPPFPEGVANLTPEERQDFYADVAAGEDGDQDALDDLRDWLITFGFEDEIVMNGVMPLLGYDYDGVSYYTFTLESDTCPIEFDIVPPQGGSYPDLELGFWEQYKTGDERFDTTETFMWEYQNCKVLMKNIRWISRRVEGRNLEFTDPIVDGLRHADNLNPTRRPDETEEGSFGALPPPIWEVCDYPEISGFTPSDLYPAEYGFPTHYEIGQYTVGPAGAEAASGWRASAWVVNYHEDGSLGGIPPDASPTPDRQHTHAPGGDIPHIPNLCLHTDYMLDSQIGTYNGDHYFYEGDFNDGGPEWESATVQTAFGSNLEPFPTFDFGYGFEAATNTNNPPYVFRESWQLCHDALPDWATSVDIFPTFRSAVRPGDPFTVFGLGRDEITWRQYLLTKEGYDWTQTVDLTENPAPGEPAITRYEQDFITFNVIAVRMAEGGPPLEAGTYLYPPA